MTQATTITPEIMLNLAIDSTRQFDVDASLLKLWAIHMYLTAHDFCIITTFDDASMQQVTFKLKDIAGSTVDKIVEIVRLCIEKRPDAVNFDGQEIFIHHRVHTVNWDSLTAGLMQD